MKIAVTSTGSSPDDLLCEQFGRCPYFIIVDSKTMNFESFINPGGNLPGGAGPKAAEFLINKDVEIVLTGHVGDKAGDALKKGGIKIVDGYKSMVKVHDVMNEYLANLL